MQLAIFLLCCAAVNILILLIWFLLFFVLCNRFTEARARLLKVSPEFFYRANLAGMIIYKIAICLLFIAPAISIIFMHYLPLNYQWGRF